jgi:putative ABC transport system permease protein
VVTFLKFAYHCKGALDQFRTPLFIKERYQFFKRAKISRKIWVLAWHSFGKPWSANLLIMLGNYIKVALRSLARNKFYGLINICGLAFGLACVFLIFEYLKLELSYDRFHEGAENIYRITWEDENPQTRTPHPMAQAMVQDFPEVQSAVSITPLWGAGLTTRIFSFRNPETDVRYEESNVMAVDSTFFDVFTFPLVEGDPKKVLKDPGGLLLSESMAKKYFGDDDPIGKQLLVNNEKKPVEVVGVFKDVPQASHFHFDFLVSYVREKSFEDPKSQFYTWNDFGHYNYIRLKPGSDARALEAKLMNWIRKYIDVPDERFSILKKRNFGFRLQPIADIHLHSHLRWELEPNGYIAYVYMLAAAALLILLIACVNFINLTTALSADRAKEIGIRKSLGAFRRQLAIQFTGESLLVSFLAMIVSVVLIELAIPVFKTFTGVDFEMNYALFAGILVGLSLLTGLLAGAFPLLYLASAKPTMILKGKFLNTGTGITFRQSFTVLQFLASMILISSSLIIYRQLNFIQNKDLGFSKEEVIVIPIRNRDDIIPRIETIRTELLSIPGIKSVSAASNIPGHSFNQNPVFATQNPQNRIDCSEEFVDPDFFDVLNIPVADGRNFSKANPADSKAFILNETAAHNLYPAGAVGKEFSWDDDENGIIQGTVIGVVKDFNFQSLHQPVQPLLFRLRSAYNYLLIKLNTSDFSSTVRSMGTTWKKFDDIFPFEFSFLTDDLNQQYQSEQDMFVVLTTFAFIAVIIACLGLLGIATLNFKLKIKEVSIRKVLGATIVNMMVLLLKDFTKVVLIAIVLAVPLVWWIMQGWLNNFTFRVQINPMIFAGSGFALLLIAWATLSYLTWKVTKVNPTEILKNE